MLITLAIIGVVAALTIPTIIHNYRENAYFAKSNKARLSIGEAGKMAVVFGEINGSSGADTFVNDVLKKHLKITKTCPSTNLQDCKFPSQIKTMAGTTITTPTTWNGITDGYAYTSKAYATNNATTRVSVQSHAFQTVDGFSVLLFYNPFCTHEGSDRADWNASCPYSYTNICPQFTLDVTCYNAIYDSNGLKGPNEVGKDIGFVSLLHNDTQAMAVSPYIYKEDSVKGGNFATAKSACSTLDGGNGKWQLPNINELSSIYLNKKIVGNFNSSANYWSGSPVPSFPSYVRSVDFYSGSRGWGGVGYSGYVRCLRRN